MALNEFQERIGVGEPSRAFKVLGDTRNRKVLVDEGPRAGQLAGFQTDHSDGRMDATVFPPTPTTKLTTHETPHTGVPLT